MTVLILKKHFVVVKIKFYETRYNGKLTQFLSIIFPKFSVINNNTTLHLLHRSIPIHFKRAFSPEPISITLINSSVYAERVQGIYDP